MTATSPQQAARILINQALRASTAVTAAFGNRIYDESPEQPVAPWVRIGEGFFVRDDVDCFDIGDDDIAIHVWSVAGGKAENARLCDLVGTALHELTLDAFPAIDPDREFVVELTHRSSQVFTDADGRTQHGVVTVRAAVERL